MTTRRESNKITMFLEIEVQDMVRYVSNYYWGLNPWDRTEIVLFQFEGSYYELFEHGSYTSSSAHFHEVSREEYMKEVNHLKEEAKEWSDAGIFDDGKTKYSLQMSESALFKESITISNGDVYSSNSILSRVEEAFAKAKAEEEAAAAERAKSKKEYARNCGKVSRRLKVAFINVLRLGYEDEEVLLSFQQSLLEAKKKLAAMPEKKRKELRHELSCGRARKSAALEFLGVQTFGKDVNYMDFSELYY